MDRLGGDHILDGLDGIVDDLFGFNDVGSSPAYRHRTSWNRLRGGPLPDFTALLEQLDTCVEKQWDRRPARSRSNWRTSKQPYLSNKAGGEKLVEKGIARHGGATWANQIPVCSGINAGYNGKRSVDLAHWEARELELIELKTTSNTILHAAIELMQYAILYCFSRDHRDALGYVRERNPLLFDYDRIQLVVLAPRSWYRGDEDAAVRLGGAINDAFSRHRQGSYALGFHFETFEAPDSLPDYSNATAYKQLIASRRPLSAIGAPVG